MKLPEKMKAQKLLLVEGKDEDYLFEDLLCAYLK